MSSLDRVSLATYLDTFCPNTLDYAYHRDGSWYRAGAPLTIEVLAAGLAGQPSISTYVVDQAGFSHVFGLDMDIDRLGVEMARDIALWMISVGVPALVEPSREERAHLWVSLDARVRASIGRRFMRKAVMSAGFDPDDPRIELFPKKDGAPEPGGVGSCLRLPMIPNPKNGRAYPLLDPRTMQPLGQTFAETAAAVRRASALKVAELAGPEPEPAAPVERDVPEHIRTFNDEFPVSEVLGDLWGVEGAEPGRSIRCPAHDDVHPSLSIFTDDRRVLCYSPDCVLNNNGRGRDAYDLYELSPAPVDQL